MDDEYMPDRGKLNGDDRNGAALHRDRRTGRSRDAGGGLPRCYLAQFTLGGDPRWTLGPSAS